MCRSSTLSFITRWKYAVGVAVCSGIQRLRVLVVHLVVVNVILQLPCTNIAGWPAVRLVLAVQFIGYNALSPVCPLSWRRYFNYPLIYFIGLVRFQYQISWLSTFKQVIFFLLCWEAHISVTVSKVFSVVIINLIQCEQETWWVFN